MKFKTVDGLEIVYVASTDWAFLSCVGMVFFLDDRVFNQDRVGAFERALRTNHHAYYYSLQKGLHYDQFEIFKGSKRIRLSAFLELSLENICLEKQGFVSFPFHGRGRDSKGLRGDFLSFSEKKQESIKTLEEYWLREDE